jgi:hypothetical protein
MSGIYKNHENAWSADIVGDLGGQAP